MGEVTHAHCNECFGKRRHEKLHTESFSWEDDEALVWGRDDYEMLRCAGCGHITLRRLQLFSEITDERGQPVVKETYFPPAVARRAPDWYGDLDWFLEYNETFLDEILGEIYAALQNGSKRLAAMGVRALLENIMVEKVGDYGSFGQNLTEFHQQGFISATQKEVLVKAFEVGHAATHRAYKPWDGELSALVDIAEAIVASLYVHPARTEDLASKVPPRQPRKSKPQA